MLATFLGIFSNLGTIAMMNGSDKLLNPVYDMYYIFARSRNYDENLSKVFASLKTKGQDNNYINGYIAAYKEIYDGNDKKARIYAAYLMKCNDKSEALKYSNAYIRHFINGHSDLSSGVYATALLNGNTEMFSARYAYAYEYARGLGYENTLTNAFSLYYARGNNLEESKEYTELYKKYSENNSKSTGTSYKDDYLIVFIDLLRKYGYENSEERIHQATEEYMKISGLSNDREKAEMCIRWFLRGNDISKVNDYYNIYRKKLEEGKSDVYSDIFASLILDGKTEEYADKYADFYISAYVKARIDNLSDLEAGKQATCLAKLAMTNL